MVSAMYLLRFEHWRVCMHICVPTPSPPANLVGRQLLEADGRLVDLQHRGAGGHLLIIRAKCTKA